MSSEKFSTSLMEDQFESQIRDWLRDLAIDDLLYTLMEMNYFVSVGSSTAYFKHDNGHKMQVEFGFDKFDNKINELTLTITY